MDLSHPTTITFVIYMVAMVAIGFAGWRGTRSLSDYLLGGRRLGRVVTALSAGASDMSGWLLMGLPGALYGEGVCGSWIAIGLTLGAWFNWRVVAARLRVYTEITHGALTLPDYFAHRFEDRTNVLRALAAMVILVFFTIYCASGMVAGARLFEQTFGLTYPFALGTGAAATILYVFVGGFLAVSWTDTVQATLMIFALLLVPVVAVMQSGGLGQAIEAIREIDPKRLDFLNGTTWIGVVSLLAWGMGYMGQPHILARFMSAASVRVIPGARRIGMTWMVLCLGGAMAAGFFGIAYFGAHPGGADPVLANRETVFITLSQVLFNPWMAGILLSGVLAAVMSTLSCQLLVCSSALTQDFYRGVIRPQASQRELVWFGRAMVLCVSVVALAIAHDPDSRILGLVGYAWAGFGSAFGPLIVLSLVWPRMTRKGALAGMLIGAITVIVWRNGGWWGLYEMIPGFGLACLAVVLGSLLDQRPSKAILKTFAQMRRGLSPN
ncbi:MAG TPA: sodium/proline symporter PutP [Candidatus Paceibacterota bacterium]|nr:sodium/proline symporter PutP [Verrucomicrobiota bacterium]HRY51197.1 sodium/proline symporter PutP [Candidatus Paceibacterota bacterium]HSA03730.1 sodium/proline symporter PutP [Candidatus Paceibacterota bacterium]